MNMNILPKRKNHAKTFTTNSQPEPLNNKIGHDLKLQETKPSSLNRKMGCLQMRCLQI